MKSVNKRIAHIAFALAAFIFAAVPASLCALSTNLESADITVVLGTDGKADIFYRLFWKASGGRMHGFYFQGEAFDPVWNLQRCYADLPGGQDRKSVV